MLQAKMKRNNNIQIEENKTRHIGIRAKYEMKKSIKHVEIILFSLLRFHCPSNDSLTLKWNEVKILEKKKNNFLFTSIIPFTMSYIIFTLCELLLFGWFVDDLYDNVQRVYALRKCFSFHERILTTSSSHFWMFVLFIISFLIRIDQ